MEDKIKQLILKIILSAGYLKKEQIDNILAKEDIYRAKLRKLSGAVTRKGRLIQPDISIIDIIDYLKIPLPASKEEYLSEELIMKAVAKYMKLPFLKIDPLKLDSDMVTKIITRPYAIKHQLITLEVTGNTLKIATANPFEREGIDGIKQSRKYDIDIVVSTKSDIMRIVTEFYGFKSSVAAAHEELTSRTDLGNLEQYVRLKSISDLDGTDQHVINATEYLLHYAYSQRASDIHVEPKRDHSSIRFRIDGILHTIHKMPKSVHPALVSRIKTLSRMDIAEKRRPQDGRIKTDHEGKEIELRVSTLPVAFGEKVVIRIFDPMILMQEVSDLGFLDRELSLVNNFLSAPHGLMLVTGPTGSGKTTTLYSALKTLATPEVNLTTIEDPIEMVYGEFNQTAIQPQIDITFASSLRTILRQDPDIIMVGEIRDFETAENAIQAALTGHLVFSTLHTNDAPSSITRLLDLGVPAFLIHSTLIGVVAQRLVRRVCPHCTEQYRITRQECISLGMDYEKLGDVSVSTGAGCSQCRGTGYIGRTGIFEVIEISENIKTAINSTANPTEIRDIAKKEGLITLRECAIERFLKGETTFEEVIRVTGHLI